ncbi:hypothetical protein COL5a_004423 [Colletotrichum fioriniae]|nr:uncharacterized protein COL516b_005720 [Colletotrichum fioriniae]KAJ0304937.1 hypothetical protein COL516b_005720 [Colletotrichum fioriniae]KAJ0329187.1 hypothetical protein COL5a_004423 [Colletotrichum fioriniae]
MPAQNVSLSQLLWWGHGLPVDAEERDRSEVVEMIEGNTNGHPEDTGFAAAAWSPGGGKRMSFIVANIEGQNNSTAFAGLETLSPVVDLRANLPVTGIAAQIASTSGEHQVSSTLAFHNILDMGRKVLASFDTVIEEIED